jgi:hypothetical protein
MMQPLRKGSRKLMSLAPRIGGRTWDFHRRKLDRVSFSLTLEPARGFFMAAEEEEDGARHNDGFGKKMALIPCVCLRWFGTMLGARISCVLYIGPSGHQITTEIVTIREG